MASTTLSAQELQQHIQSDTQTCTALLTLLKQEQEALKARNTEEIERILQQKMTLFKADLTCICIAQ